MKKLRRLWLDDRALLREGRRVLPSLPSDLAVVAAVGEGGAPRSRPHAHARPTSS